MPGGDRTGPLGLGPRTGRAAGYCAGFSGPGYINSVPGQGFGQGLGRGVGRRFLRRRMFWRNTYYQYPYNPVFQGDYSDQNKETEKSYLEEMVKDLEEEIKNIRERIKELTEEK